MRCTEHPLRKILELTQDQWDHPGERDVVRDNFRKVRMCRTPALGGEVYASATGERVFYNTCKSKCCPSCGNRSTLLWQREQWATLPDIPFLGIVLTMPDVFWPIFKAHGHLQHDLPALGAATLQQWAWNRHRVRLCAIVIQHTFGGRLNHHPHLHLMVSAGGLKLAEARWVKSLIFDHEQIMDLWRFAITSYLWKAHRDGLLCKSSVPEEFNDLIHTQLQRGWNIHITSRMSKGHFLRYAGRYIRRLPISQKRVLNVTDQEVVYQIKDTRRSKETRMAILLEVRCTSAEFVAMLSQHILDRYRHSMRYFGLLAPRTKRQTSATMFALLGQRPRPRPPRQPWADSLIKHFGVDPLIDASGNRMRWVGYRSAVPPP
jgi:Putative transposase/Transposase zinc-binding domain